MTAKQSKRQQQAMAARQRDAKNAQAPATASVRTLDHLIQTPQQELHEDIKEAFPSGTVGDYRIVDYLGWGEQATALVLEDKEGNKHVGKVFEGSFNLAKWKRAQSNLARGIEISKALHHPGIPEYHDLIELKDERQFVVVREYVQGTSLADMIKEKGHLTPEELKPILNGTLECLEYLQDESQHPEVGVVCHRDVNPRHIIIDKNGKVSLIDLDTLKDADSGATQLTSVGSKKYAHPNALIGETSPAYDIFSLGFSAAEALLGNIPKELDRSRMYGGKPYELPEWISEFIRPTLNRMINPDEEVLFSSALDVRKSLDPFAFEDSLEITVLGEPLEERVEEDLDLEVKNTQRGFSHFYDQFESHLIPMIVNDLQKINRSNNYEDNQLSVNNPYEITNFKFLKTSTMLLYIEGTGLTEENIKARNKAEKRLKRRLRKEVRDYISSSRRTDSYRKSIQTEEVLNYLTTTKHPSFNDIAFYFDNNTFFLGEEKDAFNSLPLTSQTTNEIKTTLNRYLSHLRRDIEKNNNIENHRTGKLTDLVTRENLTENELTVLERDYFYKNPRKFKGLGLLTVSTNIFAYNAYFEAIASGDPITAAISGTLSLAFNIGLVRMGIKHLLDYKRKVVDKIDVLVKDHIRSTNEIPDLRVIETFGKDIDANIEEPIYDENNILNQFTYIPRSIFYDIKKNSQTLLICGLAQARYITERIKPHKPKQLETSSLEERLVPSSTSYLKYHLSQTEAAKDYRKSLNDFYIIQNSNHDLLDIIGNMEWIEEARKEAGFSENHKPYQKAKKLYNQIIKEFS